MDAVCTHYPDPTGLGLDRKMVYWEISRLTYGVNRLGPYTLDEKSLYVDGKQWPPSLCCNDEPTFSSLHFVILNFHSFLHLLCRLHTSDCGYHHTE